jgi:6-methylsalicylic acid synthase
VSLDRTSPVDSLAGLDAEQLRERLRQEIAAQIAAEMGLSGLQLDPRRSLTEQGLDSVLTVVIRRRLEIRYAHPLPSTLLWQQPTVSAIADHLADLLAPVAEERA